MTVDLYYTARSTDILSHEAHPCPVCHRASFWFSYRDGKGACVSCMLEEQETHE